MENGARIRAFFSGRILPSFGKYGYGYYVVHAPNVLLLHGNGWDARLVPKVFGSHLPGIALFTLVVGVASFVAAVASYHLFESCFLRSKDRISPARRAPAAAAPAFPPGGRTAAEGAAGPVA